MSDIYVPNTDVSRNEFYIVDTEAVTLWNNTKASIPVDLLGLDGEVQHVEMQVRNYQSNSISCMSFTERLQLVSELKNIPSDNPGAGVGDLVEREIYEVVTEAEKGLRIDRLLALLYALWFITRQANIERNASAAKFAEISVQQAQAAGEKGVSAANCNFGGAVAALVLGVSVAGLGYRQFVKGTNGQIANINDNGRGVNRLRTLNVNSNNAMSRQPAPASGNTPHERFRTIDTENGELRIQNNQPYLSHEEQSVLQQPMNRMDVRIAGQQASHAELQNEHSKTQMGGQTIVQSSFIFSQMAQNTAAIPASEKTAEGKVNEANEQVAAQMQHKDEQAAQQSTDALQRNASMAISIMEEANRNAGDLSRSIKA